MSLLSERAITVHAQASPTDAKRSHPSARLGWVTFWVTQKSHRAKTLNGERFTAEFESPGNKRVHCSAQLRAIVTARLRYRRRDRLRASLCRRRADPGRAQRRGRPTYGRGHRDPEQLLPIGSVSRRYASLLCIRVQGAVRPKIRRARSVRTRLIDPALEFAGKASAPGGSSDGPRTCRTPVRQLHASPCSPATPGT
jgi:hypothetical protein